MVKEFCLLIVVTIQAYSLTATLPLENFPESNLTPGRQRREKRSKGDKRSGKKSNYYPYIQKLLVHRRSQVKDLMSYKTFNRKKWSVNCPKFNLKNQGSGLLAEFVLLVNAPFFFIQVSTTYFPISLPIRNPVSLSIRK